MAKRKQPGKQLSPVSKGQGKLPTPDQLLKDVRDLIRQAREEVAQAVNAALVLLYWQVGQRIRTDILKQMRAAYGEQIVPTVSAQSVPRVRPGVRQAQPISHDPLRRGVS
jgi:hypothetical protein